jgi:hypothetical protein
LEEKGPVKQLAWTFVGLGFLSILFAAFAWLEGATSGPDYLSNENSAVGTLKTFVSAEAAFRDIDRDCDGVRRYWREDVATLYTLNPGGSTEMIKLIELSAANADFAPVDPWWAATWPKAGYWFAALRFEDEVAFDQTRFVFCAVPSILATGRFVYAVTHEGVVWRKPARGSRDFPACFPLDPSKQGWRKLD